MTSERSPGSSDLVFVRRAAVLVATSVLVVAVLTGVVFSSGPRRPPPGAARAAASGKGRIAKSAPKEAGRKVSVDLFGEDLEAGLLALDKALGASSAPVDELSIDGFSGPFAEPGVRYLCER